MNLPDPRQIFALDRRAVARAFDRASASYDAAAALQERVRNELIGRLDELKITPASILDLGAGTGHGARALKRRFPGAQVVAVDIAPGMLERARRQSRWLRRFGRVRADAYALPFRDGAFDLVFSNLMLQWCDDLDAVFAEIARVLAPGGLLLFSTFGPGTLAELREAWASSDDASNHVNHFFDAHALGSALMHAQLSEPVLDVDRIVERYPDAMTPDARAQGHRCAQRDAGPRARTHRATTTRGHGQRLRNAAPGRKIARDLGSDSCQCLGRAAPRPATLQDFRAKRSSAPDSIRRRGQT